MLLRGDDPVRVKPVQATNFKLTMRHLRLSYDVEEGYSSLLWVRKPGWISWDGKW
ncbi:hypothetical protein ASPFODRAFT_41347 [Aspergillus luchuensis CBS 106.47]|uniref:Uncharacterized protein n=1 Tax=Aspergillus luchuensis (strain CBS 106.47) TaxID=1137211 RepID=A0A1M3TWD7_ASPLC|nr:hypothetical protein ASPFODRAFT_41347 [Aspergillus luchuensis CBS 106.47]